MILRGSSGLPKISRVGFETVDIFKDYIGFISVSMDFIIGVILVISVSPIISIDSSNIIKLGISNTNSIERVEIAFEFSKND